MDASSHKEIVEDLSTPLLFGKLIFSDSGSLSDIEFVYTNKIYKTVFGSNPEPGTKLSEFIGDAPVNANWRSNIERTIKDNSEYDSSILINGTPKWYIIRATKFEDDYVLITYTDITKYKEYEQQLKRQNLRLAALTDELSISREELKQKLENIELLNEKLQFHAYHDALTQISNRAKLTEDIKVLIKKSEENETHFGIILLNLDNMKFVNDSQGHAMGDEIIKQSVSILKNFEKAGLFTYRLDGDEFVLLAENITTKDSLINTADAILEYFNMSGIQFSAGISVYPDDSTVASDLLRYADMAMNDAKKGGKNNVVLYRSVMHEKFMQRLNLQTHLNEAIEKKIFVMYYQPQFNVATGELRGFEALLRWHDDQLGWINPEKFIPIAEETKLILPMGDWILETAISTLARWHEKYNFNGIMSVNVSPIQLKNADFIFTLKNLVEQYKINPRNLEIEVTEGVLIENKEQIIKLLRQIRDMGIGISLDDFGTGYSSLSYLQMLPITTLKIDKSFIANITSSEGVEANITDSIVSMVTKMGLETIAEGVEHTDQLDLLKKIKCQNVQGFLRGKPMPADRCESVLSGDESALLTILNDKK